MPLARAWPAVRAAPLLGILLLAGCLAATPDPPAPMASGPTTHQWGLVECDFVIARVPVAPEDVQPLLPQGFTPVLAAPDAGAGLVPTAEFHLDAYECRHGVAFDGSPVALPRYGSFYVPVVPPSELREPGYDAYFVKLDTLQSDDNTRAVFEAAGLPVHDGDAQAGPGLGGLWSASLALEEGGGFALATGVVGQPTPQGAPLPFIEFTPLAGGGLARWHARLHDATLYDGVGQFTPSPGLATEVLGA
ncbi:MAG: hypothetical protein QOC71_1627, partial [Thermoplasmata archaeon]|nr:hypothetical protein [Thermoplasmata archaeon]